jgi:stage II sporulation protein R
MKKIVIILAIIISILSLNKEEQVIIPKESIRFRIIANSNTEDDQLLKKKIVTNLQSELINTNQTTLENTRKYIIKDLPKFEKIVEKTLEEENNTTNFTINYGNNYFPEKSYKNVVYQEGDYESLVITLGDGEGENFWCVLFPPLCLIDENNEDVEYKSLIKEVLDKYF